MATIKGKWKWNKTCIYSELFSVWGEIHLVSNGEEFAFLRVESDVYWGEEPPLMCYRVYYEKHNEEQGIAAWFLENGEVSRQFEYESFEIEEQEIDDELYAFIVANATDITPFTMAEKLTKIAENQQKIYDAGKQAEYDAFWNMIQDHGNRTDYGQAFRNWRSRTEYLRPKYKVVPTASTSAMNTFYNCEGLKKVEAEYFDFSKKARGAYQGSGWYHTFTTCGELEEIEDIGIMPDTDLTNTFAHCPNLKKVAMIRVDVNTYISSGIFENCRSLESVTFDGEIGYGMNLKWSTKLNRASIESIINHLSDNVSGKTLTLSKTAVDEAFEFVTEINGETYISKGSDEDNPYWQDLVATKPNWTITLV